MPFIPHTDAEIKEMLQEIGVDSIDQLYDEIPASLRKVKLRAIPNGLSEMGVRNLIADKLKADKPGISFIGAGAYDHHIPAAVSAIISRGEFLTAYTPYQAEASQGNLQLIYEYQTMISSLMGMSVANASVYDGASALTEAILMAVRSAKQKEKIVLIPRAVHPAYRYVANSIVSQQNIIIKEIDFDLATGKTSLTHLKQFTNDKVSALVIPFPNFFGVLEDVDELTDWAHAQNALAIAVVNPIAMGLLKEPGKWGKQGADIACGEGQPLGIPLASGGPYFGFMACKKNLVRQIPGRIVGRTVDMKGEQGFTLTLQAREQHIRRAKATSNICTNQGLMVTAATIYMALLGPKGLRQVASACHAGANELLARLTRDQLGQRMFSAPFFHEFVIRLPRPAAPLLRELADKGIQGGYDLSKEYPELGDAVLICVTETKTETNLSDYCVLFEKTLTNAPLHEEVT